jgi:hypothetical protein
MVHNPRTTFSFSRKSPTSVPSFSREPPASGSTLVAGLCCLVLLSVFAAPAAACNVPVFRYALEKWPAEPYEVVILHKGPLGAGDRELVQSLQKIAAAAPPQANIAVEAIDLARRPDEEAQELHHRFPDFDLPMMVVRYPGTAGIDSDVWSGKLSATNIQTLLDSPARRKVKERILRGDSAVWIFLESGDRARDRAAVALLETELHRLERELKLPACNDDLEDQVSTEGPPLRIAFTLLRVARSDPAEQMLVRMLLNSESDLPGRLEPIVFPVYGRGRALYAIVGPGINRENIVAAARHVVGPCTCTIKEGNPGIDLLFSVRWDQLLTGRMVKDRDPPALASLAEFAAQYKGKAESHVPLPSSSVAPTPESEPEPVPGTGTWLAWNVLLAVVAGLAILAVTAFVFLKRLT